LRFVEINLKAIHSETTAGITTQCWHRQKDPLNDDAVLDFVSALINCHYAVLITSVNLGHKTSANLPGFA